VKPGPALAYLEAHPNEWVTVTHSSTIDAIRELRAEGHRIVTRPDPDTGERQVKFTPPEPDVLAQLASKAAEIFEERPPADDASCPHVSASPRPDDGQLVCIACGEVLERTVTPGEAGRRNPMKRVEDANGVIRYEVAYETCPECGEQYLYRDDHVSGSLRHEKWLAGELQPEIPVPVQRDTYRYPEGADLGRLVFGTFVICSRCKGKRVGERRVKGAVIPAQTFTSAPRKPGEPCPACNGHGIVPNIGPNASAPQGDTRD
jgi:hypothetical protein